MISLTVSMPDWIDASSLVAQYWPSRILEHVGGHDRIALDGLDQILANHEARKAIVDLVVERGHGDVRQKSKSAVKAAAQRVARLRGTSR